MISLGSISFDLSGWGVQELAKGRTTWVDAEGDLLGLTFHAMPPDMPPPQDGIVALRDFLREQVLNSEGGLVEVEPMTVQGIAATWMMAKWRLPGGGFSYQGTCFLPRRDFAYGLRLSCHNGGGNGLREATVRSHPAAAGKPWTADPYDAGFDAQALRSVADDARYDATFPAHPLSRARRKLRAVIGGIRFTEAVRRAPAFGSAPVETIATETPAASSAPAG